jgi:hypothetical protein
MNMLGAPKYTVNIGRRRDFYIPTIPSNLGNIPNVNKYTNVFYISWLTGLISYIYKLATSSHVKLRLSRWHLWLCSFLIPQSLSHEDHRLLWLPNQIFINSPYFANPWSSQVPDSRSSQGPDSRTLQVSTILKWTADSRERARFGNHFRTLLENLKTLETRHDPFMNVLLSRNWSSHPEGDSRTYLTNSGKPDVSRV